MSDETTAAGSNPDDADEGVLLAELRQLTAMIDPVPPEAVAAARSAFAWRTMDAELAELASEISADAMSAGVRGTAVPTLLTFEATGLTIELEVLEITAGRRLLGQLVPPGPGAVEVRHRGGVVRVPVDEVGRFSADEVAAGPLSLRCSTATAVVETDWFLA